MAGDDEASVFDDGEASVTPRERPWLLPYNRKLRHLQGITIRNLTLTPVPSRPRTKTIDDEAIPSTLKTPTKALALALREQRNLTHSRSSSDLKAAEDDVKLNNGGLQHPSSPSKAVRPGTAKGMRRRSTMEWAGASPLTRQKKLEDVIDGRMADTFFSLHVEGHDQPIYISETVDKAMNPNFRHFDLGSCGPNITRLDKLTVKVWASNEDTKGWQYLMDFTVQLRTLQFIGKTLGNFRHALPRNCILFHMTDGIYTSFTDLPVREQFRPAELAAPKENPDGRVLASSSYDALMRLSTLDDCIQDALTTRDRLADEIETILGRHKEGISIIEQVPEADDRLKTVELAVNAEKRRVDAVRRRRDELKASIQFRKEQAKAGRGLQQKIEADLVVQKEAHQHTKASLEKTDEDIAGQRRRICEDLQKIFPIEPIAGKSLAFTIRGLPLPNSEFDDAKEEVIAAALGYVAQVVSLLSPYFSVILPYPITLNGSSSTIDDPLAMSTNIQNNPRTFPLFMKGIVRYRFEYGVFLLNKNIEILSNSLGLRPVDIRHTLPNLKYFLFVATAGKGELPARKAGGIRGLFRHEGLSSRKGSMDSTATGSSVGASDLRHDLEEMAKKADAAKANGSASRAKAAIQKKATLLPGSRLREVE